MIDLHTHYLPGVDDGAPTMEACLEMLRIAESDGIEVLVATPHQLHPAGYHAAPGEARASLEEVRSAASAAGIRVELRLSAEIHFSEVISEGLSQGRLLPMGSRHFLLELPVTTVPHNIKEAVFEFQTRGRFPILAHPERNFEIMDRPEIARDLRNRGVPLQLTAMSITGAFGRKSEKAARKLLKWGVVDVIASDAHNPKRRPPLLSAAVQRAAKIVGRGRAEAMVGEIPERILEGDGLV
jgi:protein-tyrosine phosphatase